MKTLLMLIALVLVVVILRHLWRQRLQQRRPTHLTQSTVRCAHCGLYLPSQDAVHDEQHSYCCREHRDAGPAA